MTTDDSISLNYLSVYNKKKPNWERLLGHVLSALGDYKIATQADQTVHSVKGRVKSYDSLIGKVSSIENFEKLDPDDAFRKITDIVAARIVCFSLSGKEMVCDWVRSLDKDKKITIVEDGPKKYPSGYRSHHFLLRLQVNEWPGIYNFSMVHLNDVFEIQIRTILEEAWGEVEHRLVYKSDYECDDYFRNRFLSLSSTLHEADLSVQRLVQEHRSHTPTSIYIPSYEIDPRRINIARDDIIQKIELALSKAKAAREKKQFKQAVRAHEELMNQPNIAFEIDKAGLLADFRCEEAFDFLLWAKSLSKQGKTKRCQELLDEAERRYDAAKDTRCGANLLFIPWRMAEVQNLRKNYEQAIQLSRAALALFDEHKISSVYRKKVHRGTLQRSIGVYYHNLWRQNKNLNSFKHADTAYEESIREFEQSLNPQEEKPNLEICREYLKSLNNQTYLYFLSVEDDKNYLTKAKQHISRAQDVIPEKVWRASLEFLDTCLAVKNQLIGEQTCLSEFEEMDAWRKRILELAGSPNCPLQRDEIDEVLSHIREFELKWSDWVRNQAFPRTSLKTKEDTPT